MGSRFALGLSVAVVIVALAGCSSAPEPAISSPYDSTDPQTWSFDQVVNQAISDAQTAHAEPAQLDELKAAKASGALTAAQARSANEAYLECVRAAGATTTSIEDRTSLGLWWPSYSVTAPRGANEASWGPLDDDCQTKNAAFVMYVYGNQPAAREALGATLKEHEAALKQCLTEMGGRDTDAMSINELWAALKDQSFGGADYGYSQDKDCIIEAGINW
jgi:hypothetical protein